jgi:isocitrate dehydrogenase kinase/phosphatase
MIPITLDDNKLKDALKQAIRELIQEDQKMISNLIVEVIEDIAFENAIKEGETSETVNRDEILNLLNPYQKTEKNLKLNVTLKKPSEQQVKQALDEFDQAVKQFLEETDITPEELAEALDLSQPLK